MPGKNPASAGLSFLLKKKSARDAGKTNSGGLFENSCQLDSPQEFHSYQRNTELTMKNVGNRIPTDQIM
jgi:hypothetical protein